MRHVSITILLFVLCATLCLGACKPDGGDVTPPPDTATTTTTVAEEETTDQTEPPINVVVNKDLVEHDFYGYKGKDHGDACFSFINEGGKTILKQERISFSDDLVANKNGKKWDAATNAWVTAGDIETAERSYNIRFKENFTEGDLVVKFQLKRDGGSKQVFCIKPSGVPKSIGAVYFSGDSLTVGDKEVHLNSHDIKKTKLPADEWLEVTVTFYVSVNGVSASAVITDEYGKVLGSVASHPQKTTVTAITGIDIIDASTTNIADFGNAAPENPTSVWYMKDLSVKANPMKTGDRIKLKYKTVNNSPDRGDIITNYITINGQQTIKAYFGRYSILPDCSGFICGTNDGNFYLYDIENQELVYLDRSSIASVEQTQIFTYVNPVTGNVFYTQKNEHGYSVLKKINPKTFEITTLYEATKSISIGIEVTHDEKYTCYTIGGWKGANVPSYVGRINLETGELEHERAIVYTESEYCVNHFIINPKYPDLVFYHREASVGAYDGKGSNVINLVTDERWSYTEPGTFSGHALWNFDGEHVTLHSPNAGGGDCLAILDKELNQVERFSMTNATHPMADENLKWAIGDTSGVSFYNIETQKQYRIYTKPSYTQKGHPFHAHSEISANGKILLYGFVNDEGVLSIGWLINPEWTE